ncbi:hypothetical protein [Microvirga antarctica]|uniref:hypothetical protein n=1 Tax=Microvirga antarctica TaxID=2819233 RepID=UPI001FE4FEA4|nr:hypothetical protein [Microvirga antarctica]
MAGFKPTSMAPNYEVGTIVEISLVDPPARADGVPNFDSPDPDRPGITRSSSILSALCGSEPLPPVVLFQRAGETRYELRDGFHRLHLFAAIGYTHVPAQITDWKPGEY